MLQTIMCPIDLFCLELFGTVQEVLTLYCDDNLANPLQQINVLNLDKWPCITQSVCNSFTTRGNQLRAVIPAQIF